MNETTYVNMFTVLRAIIFGGILIVIPVVTRKGLLFGTYVGEEAAEGEAARRLLRSWYLACGLLALLAMGVGLGISFLGRPLAGNYTCLGILLLTGPVLYIRWHRKSRALAPPTAALQAETATAPLEVGPPKGEAFARVTLGICLLAGLATVVYAWLGRDAGAGESLADLMVLPVMNLIMSPFIALMALLTARAKRSVRGGSGGRSAEAQVAFRAAVTNMLSGTALFTCALLTFLSLPETWEGTFMVTGVFLISMAMMVFLFAYIVRIIVKYGQGGARMEMGSSQAPLTDGLADNTHWIWGVFYFDRNDPSILVEKRFGIGYTLNFGNRKALLILLLLLVMFLGLAALTLIAALD